MYDWNDHGVFSVVFGALAAAGRCDDVFVDEAFEKWVGTEGPSLVEFIESFVPQESEANDGR